MGKTSLLRMVCGLAHLHHGEVRWRDALISDSAAHFHRDLFYVGHALSLKEELSALENLMADAAVAGTSVSVVQARAALEAMGLRGRDHLPLRVLSQGQKRRVALARLNLTQAPLWVLDEPFVALDTRAIDHVRAVLGAHVAQGGMVLFTSHQPVALSVAGRDQAVLTFALEPAP